MKPGVGGYSYLPTTYPFQWPADPGFYTPGPTSQVPFTQPGPLRRFVPAYTMSPQDTAQTQVMSGNDPVLAPPVTWPPQAPAPQTLPGLGDRGPLSPLATQMGMTGADPALSGASPLTPPETSSPLSGLAQMMSQPLIPQDNPYMQAGTILSGFAAGMRGTENPVIKQLLAEREMQTNRAIQLGTLGLHLQQFAQARFEKEREFQLKQEDESYRRAENALKIGSEIVFKSGPDVSPTMKSFGARTMTAGLKGIGLDVSPAEEAALTTSTLSSETMKDIAVQVMAGFSPEDISSWKKVPIGQVTVVQKALQKEDFTKALNLPSPASLKQTADEQRLRDLKIASEEMGLKDPKLGETARLMAFKDFHTRIEFLNDAEKKQVAINALAFNLEQDMAKGGIPPVGAQQASAIISGERIMHSLETLKELLKGGTVDQYIGPLMTGAPIREWWARNAPAGWVSKVPTELSLFGIAEAQMVGEIRRLQAGQAVTPYEGAFVLQQVPNRPSDKKEVYEVKLDYMMGVIKAAHDREVEFAGAGGRAALNPTYRAMIMQKHPLPDPPGSLALPELAPSESHYYNPSTRAYKVGPTGAPPPEGFIQLGPR